MSGSPKKFELKEFTFELDTDGDVEVSIDVESTFTWLTPKEATDLANALLEMVKQ